MRDKAYRIHKTNSKANRRMSEDRNQHYERLDCPCAGVGDKRTVGKIKSFMANNPQRCSSPLCCGNHRPVYGPTHSEKKQLLRDKDYKLFD